MVMVRFSRVCRVVFRMVTRRLDVMQFVTKDAGNASLLQEDRDGARTLPRHPVECGLVLWF